MIIYPISIFFWSVEGNSLSNAQFIRIDLRNLPILSWNWRVHHKCRKNDRDEGI